MGLVDKLLTTIPIPMVISVKPNIAIGSQIVF
jgi:hypothetical protein